LLAVLWLSAALAAIAFAVALGVRGETARAANALEGARARYLAAGALDCALYYMLAGPSLRNSDGTPRYNPMIPIIPMRFPAGRAVVEVRPESGKLNVNLMPPPQLERLLLALGCAPDRAREITLGILDWRGPGAPGGLFDMYYLSLTPSFRARHASLEQIEELMLVRGVTPELFYGRFEKTDDGSIRPRAGLRDCLTVYGDPGPLDAASVEPETLIASGAPPEGALQFALLRRAQPLTPAMLAQVAPLLGPAVAALRLGGGPFFTLRATAQPVNATGGFSDLRRSVAMTIVIPEKPQEARYRILRWYEDASRPGAVGATWWQ
jgi:general secretion pathway protein K